MVSPPGSIGVGLAMAKSFPVPHPSTLLARAGCLTVFLSVLAFSMLCSSLMSGVMLIADPTIFVIAAGLATATAVPYAAFLLWLDRNEKEPAFLIALAFLWGAMAATTLTIPTSLFSTGVVVLASDSPELAGLFATSIAAPVFEEFFKGIGVLGIAIAFHKEFDNVLDGIIYGAIAGLGFAWFENILYYQGEGTEEGIAAMGTLAVARGVYHGIAGHVTFTALTGIGIGLARVQRRGALRWLWPIVGLGLGTASHFIWNTFSGVVMLPAPSETAALLFFLPMAVVLLQLPFVGLVGLVLLFVWRHENQIIADSLATEPEDILAPDDIESLVPARRRNQRSLGRLFRRGPTAWWRYRMVDRALIDLAFALWHHRRDHPEVPAEDNPAVTRLRAKVRARRAQLGPLQAKVA
jgi:protease PrsW